ncbi:MAG TPA: DUF1937 family protein [Candidatus Angelobacter sp.]|nr:DUF1937 family protein [Candidatus Angelobacter sp.]
MSYWYLATPYSKYPDGITTAFRVACEQTALLVRARIPVFCPIAHTHPIALEGGIDPYDHTIWIPADKPFMECSKGLIFCKLPSWEISDGMRIEREFFESQKRPVIDMTPGVVPHELLS